MALNLNLLGRGFAKHPFHFVTSSPWPLFTAFALFGCAIGAVASMHGYVNGSVILKNDSILLVTCIFLWLWDVIVESTFLGDHSKEVKKGLVIGFQLFIVSEIFAFLSVFWAYFHSGLAPSIEIGSKWPPLGIEPLNTYSVPLLNTIILLASGAYITFGHHAFISAIRKQANKGFIYTILLAILFTGLQYSEYLDTSYDISDSVFSSAFFCLTGLHGIHVMLGTIGLVWAILRIVLYHMTVESHVGAGLPIYYWHFVDVVWLALYGIVYAWGSAVI